ncbi:MAG: U32 family peptidase [Bacteroidaceae bacterium]|nr:U32 family peptidase [Bacteroidaceae bacterium]
MREIELLAPARDLKTGREAILHGADAVYVGAPKFGARAAAGNSVEDIAELVSFAHAYKVKVYVTLNTILYDNELDEARRLARQLADAGVDALIVQDMALLNSQFIIHNSQLRLHASTQMDNRTAEKVRWLRDLGFEQVVLARELTLEEIREIHEMVPDVRLEVFVHGAICVSYNGQCYASQYCFGRSANRGECAQFCRMPFDLVTEDGQVLQRQRHLLSLRDMNRSNDLEALLDAGVSSLKIEGRLKDVSYVKNVVAYYRQRLDEILRRRPEYRRSSLGHEAITFTPNPAKSFNRLFTDYFLHGRTPDMANIYTPKSMGEPLDAQSRLHNGDGLCYLNDEGLLEGFRVNRVDGDKIYLANGAVLPRGTRGGLYRNYDHDFEQQLSKPTATRKVGVRWLLKEVPDGFLLRLTREDGFATEETFPYPHELARSPQAEPITRQLSRLGDTPYEAMGIDIDMTQDWFIPGSVLAEWRRICAEAMLRQGAKFNVQDADNHEPCILNSELAKPQASSLSYLANVANHEARQFYLDHGATRVDWAMEVNPKSAGPQPLIMTCRYCIRHELGLCHKAPAVPLFLRLADGRRFRLHFDCKRCLMEVYAEE